MYPRRMGDLNPHLVTRILGLSLVIPQSQVGSSRFFRVKKGLSADNVSRVFTPPLDIEVNVSWKDSQFVRYSN